MSSKYAHTNINTPDWKRLVQFYIKVFDSKLIPPTRHLYGEWFEKASGIKDAEVHGAHITLPGYDVNGPTLEIFTHTIKNGEQSTTFHQQGYAHIAIAVDDVDATYKKIIENGGSSDGEIVTEYYENMNKTLTMVYAKDPDGNIIEIQKWTD